MLLRHFNTIIGMRDFIERENIVSFSDFLEDPVADPGDGFTPIQVFNLYAAPVIKIIDIDPDVQVALLIVRNVAAVERQNDILAP